MPKKGGRATPQERMFTGALVAYGDPKRAAEIAGYANPDTNGYRVAARPAIAAEVARLQLERLQREGAPLAVSTLIEIMQNEAAPANARIHAAKITLQHAVGEPGALADKEDHELTPAELQAKIDGLQRQRAQLIAVDTIDQAGDVFD